MKEVLTKIEIPAAAEEEGCPSPDWSRLADEANGSRVSFYSSTHAEEQGPHSTPQRRRNSIQVAALLHSHDEQVIEDEGEDSDEEEVVIPLNSLIQMAAHEEIASSATGSRSSSAVSLTRLSALKETNSVVLPHPSSAPRASSLTRDRQSSISTSQHTSFSGRDRAASQIERGVIVRVKKCEGFRLPFPASTGSCESSHRRSKSWMGP